MFRISKIQFFESNSQPSRGGRRPILVVQNIKDTIFWKQFTTFFKLFFSFFWLFRISKIQFFESNSQRTECDKFRLLCCSEYQRYNFLKAIHNRAFVLFDYAFVVQNIKDTIFWKQFTTEYQELFLFLGCSEYQRYNFLKAIHNHLYNV